MKPKKPNRTEPKQKKKLSQPGKNRAKMKKSSQTRKTEPNQFELVLS
jgi:hypothetical protein